MVTDTRIESITATYGIRSEEPRILLEQISRSSTTVTNLHRAQLKGLKVMYVPITCTNRENRDFEQNNSLEFLHIGESSVDRLLGSLSGPCSKLEMLHLRDNRITKLPSEFNFPNLKDLDLRVAMEVFGCSSVSLPRLTKLRLDGCGLLTEVPLTSCTALEDLTLTGLPGLQELQLHGSIKKVGLEALPSLVQVGCVEIGTALALDHLWIINCERLAVLPSPLPALMRLALQELPSLVEFGSEAEYPSLYHLSVSKCEKLRNIPHPMRSLHSLHLSKLPSLVQIGAEFPRLRELKIFECERLAGLPPRLTDLTISTPDNMPTIDPPLSHCDLMSLPLLEEFAPEVEFPGVEAMSIYQCERLARLSAGQLRELNLWGELPPLVEIAPLPSTLERLTIRECGSLRTVPSAPGLKDLDLATLPSLVEIGPEYPSLTYLSIRDCERLATVPSAPRLKMLLLYKLPSLVEVGPDFASFTDLDIVDCESLRMLPCAPQLDYLRLDGDSFSRLIAAWRRDFPHQFN